MFLFQKKKIAKGLDRTVLATGSCGPTSVLGVHGIDKKSSSLCLKNQFSSLFSVFTVRPPGPVWVWKPWSHDDSHAYHCQHVWYSRGCIFYTSPALHVAHWIVVFNFINHVNYNFKKKKRRKELLFVFHHTYAN